MKYSVVDSRVILTGNIALGVQELLSLGIVMCYCNKVFKWYIGSEFGEKFQRDLNTNLSITREAHNNLKKRIETK